jgi:DNA-binding winged helix-turn-helix (wHTH) protein/tetratricopeptide (TPR) repeat protein
MSNETKSLYEFGPYRLDPGRKLLLRNGDLVALTSKALEILLVLVERSQHVVTKDELMREVWPNSFVEEANLTQHISMVRKALGETPQDHRYIVTFPGQGYRFAGGVRIVCQNGADRVLESGFSSRMGTEQTEEFPGRSAPEPLVPGDGRRIERDDDIHPTPARSRTFWWAAVFVVFTLSIASGTFWFVAHRATALTAKDTVVLADFVNSTGDPVFDGTLRQGLAIQLEQSPFLSITSDQRNEQTLKMMGQPADAKLTPAIARELCQRTGSAAALNGSVAQIGTGYLLTLRAVNCSSGDSLASTEAQARDKNHVLDALGKTAADMRNKLGESLSTVQKFDTPLEQATTPSLEALKAYSLGRKAMASSEWAVAVAFFQRAIRIDPNFSMAYARQGTCYRMLGEPNLASENSRKAYELRESVSELEKFYIESHYYQQATGELEKARQVYELWAQSYPRDWGRASAETAVSAMLGQGDEGLAESREELRLNPTGEGYSDLLYFYMSLNRLDEARSAVEEMQAKKFDSPFLRALLYKLRFLQDDTAGMSQQVVWAVGRPGAEDALLRLEAETAAYSGRLGRARELSRQAIVSAKRAEEPELAAGYESAAAFREALFGNAAEARERAGEALDLSNSADVESLSALALSIAGDAVRAETLADDLDKRFPEHTIVQSYYLPTLRAQLALSRDDPSRAVEVLQAAAPYELSSSGALFPVYVRGESYLAAHRGNEAAAEFQKILDHRGIVVNAPIGALAHLGQGRAYALSGDKTRAKIAYQDFLTLWKGADPDIPVLKQAKAEYAKLN